MCHPVILWYGCDHLTLTQLKCPLDVLNMEHISDELILACSGNACCLCALPMIPNIQELKSNWLSSSKVAKFFNVETDDRNIEKFIILFFEMGHHVQCEEHAALRLDVATTSRSPPASESGTPAPEPAVEPTQVPSPRSPVAKQNKRGHSASQNKLPQNTQKNKASTSKQSETTTTSQTQTQTQVVQKPPHSQPTPAIQPKPMATAAKATAPAPAQTYANTQCPQPTPTFQPVLTPQNFSQQPFPTPISPPLLKTKEDALLAETFLQWKHELDLSGGDFTDVDFEDIQAYIELEEKSGTKHENQGPIQGLTGAGAVFDAELQQVSQPPTVHHSVKAQGDRIENRAHAGAALDTTVQQQQSRPIQRQAQNIQTCSDVDATFQQHRMSPVHYDAHLQTPRPVKPNFHAQQPQQNSTPLHHTTQELPNMNVNVQLPLQRAPVQNAAGSSVHTHPVQHTAQRPVNVDTHVQLSLQAAPIQHPSNDAHPQHPIQKPACVDGHAQRSQQPNAPTQHSVQSVPHQRAPPQPVPQQNTAPQQLHNTTAHPEQATTPYDGTNWGDKGVYLPDKNVYFAGDKPHSPKLDALPLPELGTNFPRSESDSLVLKGHFDEQASFLEFTNIDELCNESGDAMMLDVAASSEHYIATVQGSHGQNRHQPADPLLLNQYGSQVAYDRVQTSDSGRSTPSHMNMNMDTQQPAVVHQFVQQPAQIVFHRNDTNSRTRLSSEEMHQIATVPKPKRKGRGRPRKAQMASVKIVDNGNSNGTTSPSNENVSTASTTSATDMPTASTSTTTIANDPTRGISKATAATSRITKQSTTTPPCPSTTTTKARSRSNSNTRTNTATASATKIKGRGRSTKKNEDNEPKGTLVTIERPPADNTADPTEEYIQRYSNPVAMLSPCSN